MPSSYGRWNDAMSLSTERAIEAHIEEIRGESNRVAAEAYAGEVRARAVELWGEYRGDEEDEDDELVYDWRCERDVDEGGDRFQVPPQVVAQVPCID